MRGRPPGKWNEKAFKDALRTAVNRATEGGGKRLARLADVLVAKGLDGDVMAIREIADRLDGKPHQTQDIAVTDQRLVAAPLEKAKSDEEWLERHKPH